MALELSKFDDPYKAIDMLLALAGPMTKEGAGTVKYFQTGGAKDKVWHIQKVGFTELPDDTPTPWTNESPTV